MQVILREEEVKRAVLNYLGLPVGTDDITEMKIRRKTAGKEDVGSVSIKFESGSSNGKHVQGISRRRPRPPS